MSELNPQEFRMALGQFATGVTVITTMDDVGQPIGVTASSFNSVSLDPPLVLWSLAKSAKSLPAFQKATGFNVHILASHQEAISNRFARASEKKFEDIDYGVCPNGRPLLRQYAALFRCETEYQYEGGDHVILVGKVIEFETMNYPALVFHKGSYADAKAKPARQYPDIPAVNLEGGSYTDDFLLYLISRAHFQSTHPVRQVGAEIGMSESEYFCLSILAMNDALCADEIVARLEHTGHQPCDDIFARLYRKNWITGARDAIVISPEGRKNFVLLLAQSKELEEQLRMHFTVDELDNAKRFLKKLISITGSNIPGLWSG